MSTQKQHDDELEALMSLLAESVADMSREQVENEFGDEPGLNVKSFLQSVLKEFDQAKLREARAKYQSATKDLSERSPKLPENALEQRALLSAFLNQRADVRSMFTAQFREFEELTDSDVESLLKQLIDLGMI